MIKTEVKLFYLENLNLSQIGNKLKFISKYLGKLFPYDILKNCIDAVWFWHYKIGWHSKNAIK